MDPDKIYDSLVRAGEQWADAEAAASLLEETRKSVLAKLMNDSAVASIAGKEMTALASDDYTDFVAGMVKARAAANKAASVTTLRRFWRSFAGPLNRRAVLNSRCDDPPRQETNGPRP
jgi:hypothetical protein